MAEAAAGPAPGGMHGFPRALTSLVGRAGEVGEVAGLLAEFRLVTLTGPGGVGKTRLAGEVARRVVGDFADGAWLADLASVREPELVPAAVAVALGVPQAADMSIAASLAGVLARQQVLLVLDNCEHMAGAAAELCEALLSAVDDVRVLATSREPVGVAGEARYRLPPLTLPLPGGQAEADKSEAVALFADRARRVDPHFALNSETGPVVARLVARLDGMPLAIELAAARVHSLGVAQLLDRLDDQFRLLAGADRAAAPRHRSLAATVDWSYQLLGEDEQRVFRFLAIFPGPFTLEAAGAVAGAAAEEAVLHLVDCSLLDPPRTGPDGRARYLMLETVRAVAADRLAEAGEQPRAAAAVARYAVQAAELAAAGMQTSAGDLAGARWLDAEDATVHQALAWALEHDPATAARIAVSAAPWWIVRGRVVSGSALLGSVADRLRKDDHAWPPVQYWLGVLASYTDMAEALRHYSMAADAASAIGDLPTMVNALANKSRALTDFGRTVEANEDARRALARAQEHGYPAGEARALFALYFVAHDDGDYEAALALARQAERIDPAAIPGKLVRISREILTRALMDAGDQDTAQRSCAAGLTLAREALDLTGQADLLILAVDLALLAGHLATAAAHIREAIDVASQIGYRDHLTQCLDHTGRLCAATQRWAEAITIWAAHATCLEDSWISDKPSNADRRRESLRKAGHALGPDRTRVAEERGEAMTLAAAAEYALLLVSENSQEPHAMPVLNQLSAREQELVTLVARGSTNAQIAAQLYISVRTVGSHLDRIRDKTGCRRRADLTRLALQAGLVSAGRYAWPGLTACRVPAVGRSTPPRSRRKRGNPAAERGNPAPARRWPGQRACTRGRNPCRTDRQERADVGRCSRRQTGGLNGRYQVRAKDASCRHKCRGPCGRDCIVWAERAKRVCCRWTGHALQRRGAASRASDRIFRQWLQAVVSE